MTGMTKHGRTHRTMIILKYWSADAYNLENSHERAKGGRDHGPEFYLVHLSSTSCQALWPHRQLPSFFSLMPLPSPSAETFRLAQRTAHHRYHRMPIKSEFHCVIGSLLKEESLGNAAQWLGTLSSELCRCL